MFKFSISKLMGSEFFFRNITEYWFEMTEETKKCPQNVKKKMLNIKQITRKRIINDIKG